MKKTDEVCQNLTHSGEDTRSNTKGLCLGIVASNEYGSRASSREGPELVNKKVPLLASNT